MFHCGWKVKSCGMKPSLPGGAAPTLSHVEGGEKRDRGRGRRGEGGSLPGTGEVLFCPMKKARIAEQAQFSRRAPSPAVALDVYVRVYRVLLEESSRAPADVTGTGRGLTGPYFHEDMMSLDSFRWLRVHTEGEFNVHYRGLVLEDLLEPDSQTKKLPLQKTTANTHWVSGSNYQRLRSVLQSNGVTFTQEL